MITVKIVRDGSFSHSYTKNQLNIAILSALNLTLMQIIRLIIYYCIDVGGAYRKFRELIFLRINTSTTQLDTDCRICKSNRRE